MLHLKGKRLFLLTFWFASQTVFSYPIVISRFESEGQIYVDSTSIVTDGNFSTLTYIENFNLTREYGNLTYNSKLTVIRINCSAKMIYLVSESYYQDADASGSLLVKVPANDLNGSYATPGSWVSDIVRVGCVLR